jgi:cellulose synthase/poly-beta-1,6-N-acetylglucosamine synthase-like glycosyltransferase
MAVVGMGTIFRRIAEGRVEIVLQYLLAPVVVAYTLVMLVLTFYISNLFYLMVVSLKNHRHLKPPSLKNLEKLPTVTVQLPIYNEWYVADRLLSACTALEYPPELLEIQVLDDSTDETVSLIADRVRRLQDQGVNIRHINRSNREGFKAGALANGLESACGEFIAIFDADFLPQKDFLKQLLPRFDDEKVAFVQARWGHLNRDYSMLTMMQAFTLDAHFLIDQFARSTSDYVFNFNGTAGIWRKSAILDAGGWKADTLTEDMDLSYRAFLRGWSARFAADVEAPAELPVSFTAYRRQQYRWARGSLECAIKYIPIIWRGKFSLARKFQATFHLTTYFLHFLALLFMLFYPFLLLFARDYPTLLAPIGLGLLMNIFALIPSMYFAAAQRILTRGWVRSIPAILAFSVFASGMAPNTLRALVQILQKRLVPFERTPKFGITDRSQNWRGNRYVIRFDSLILFEILLGCFNLWSAWLAWSLGYYLMMFYAVVFALGLFFFSGFTLYQSLTFRFARDSKPVSA